MRLANKVAIITGGASGFGAEMVRQFTAQGAQVMIADLNATLGEALAKEQGGAFCRTDVSNEADIQNLLSKTIASFGRIDVVVNNAGVTHPNQPAITVSEADFDRVFRVNVKSLFFMAKHVAPLMQDKGGAIVNVASITGVRPGPGLAWYGSSKAAVIAATKALALELAKSKIRVNVINPMLGETPMLTQFMGGQDSPEARERFLARIPLGRLTQASDVAAAALYLASEEASFITGMSMDVDGGRNI